MVPVPYCTGCIIKFSPMGSNEKKENSQNISNRKIRKLFYDIGIP